jgi:hypothetical protein
MPRQQKLRKQAALRGYGGNREYKGSPSIATQIKQRTTVQKAYSNRYSNGKPERGIQAI